MNKKSKGGPPSKPVVQSQPVPAPTLSNAQQQQQQNTQTFNSLFGLPNSNAQQQQAANQSLFTNAQQQQYANISNSNSNSNNYVPLNMPNVQQAPNMPLFGNVSGGVYGARQAPMGRVMPMQQQTPME